MQSIETAVEASITEIPYLETRASSTDLPTLGLPLTASQCPSGA